MIDNKIMEIYKRKIGIRLANTVSVSPVSVAIN